MPTPPGGLERPVFVDPSGRRRRLVRRLAITTCALLATYAVLLGAALSGAPIPPSALLPLPGTADTTEPAAITGQQNQQPVAPAGTTATSTHATTDPTTMSATSSTPTSQPTAATTTTTTGNRNPHAPTTPPGRTKHTDTTTPTP